jgi:hypothetical protein
MTVAWPVSSAPNAAARMPGASAFQARGERDIGVGGGRRRGHAAPRWRAPDTALARFRSIRVHRVTTIVRSRMRGASATVAR